MMQAARVALRSSGRVMTRSQTPAMVASSNLTPQFRTFKTTMQSYNENEKGLGEKVKEQVNVVVEKAQEVLGKAKEQVDEAQKSASSQDSQKKEDGGGEDASSAQQSEQSGSSGGSDQKQ